MLISRPMIEFKFACPVCGQHVSATAADSGRQMECPTCFQKMEVPTAPSGPSNLILRATPIPDRARPNSLLSNPLPGHSGPKHPSGFRKWRILLWALAISATCTLGVPLIRWSERWLSQTKPTESSVSAPATNGFPWSLGVTNAITLEQPVSGNLHRIPFTPEKVVLQGGVLTFRQGQSPIPDLALVLVLHAFRGEDLAGKTVVISSDRPAAPSIAVRWQAEKGKPATERYHNGYALKISFGQPAGGRMPGNIWLCLPDPDCGFLAGAFDAEIRRPSQSRGTSPPKRR